MATSSSATGSAAAAAAANSDALTDIVITEYDNDQDGYDGGGGGGSSGQEYLVRCTEDPLSQVTNVTERAHAPAIIIQKQSPSHVNDVPSSSSLPLYPFLSSLSRLGRSIRQTTSDLFLPVGYPHTVRAGYLQYQCYDSLQGLCSYLRGVLCHAAVLEAAGVGNAEATAWAAATTWALKDGVAMIGGLVYSYIVARQLDTHVKEFRLLADIANDVGLTLDMMAPYFGRDYFLHVSSAAVLCKTICGISAGATKGSITLHFASAGNMADLNAKESTQETLVSLLGMLLGVWAARTLRHLDDNRQARWNWFLFVVLTIIHVWANYRGVLLLRLRTLNRARTDLVLAPLWTSIVQNVQRHLETDQDKVGKNSLTLSDLVNDGGGGDVLQLPGPEHIQESLWYAWNKYWNADLDRLKLNLSLKAWLEQQPPSLLTTTNNVRRLLLGTGTSTTERYRTSTLQNSANRTTRGTSRHTTPVGVCLLVGATPLDQFKAYVHGSLIVELLDKADSLDQNHALLHQVAQNVVDVLFTPPAPAADKSGSGSDDNATAATGWLVSELRRKGWEVDGQFYLGFAPNRSQWKTTTRPETSMDDTNSVPESKKEK